MHSLQTKYETSKEQFGACHRKSKLQIYVCVPEYATWHGLHTKGRISKEATNLYHYCA